MFSFCGINVKNDPADRTLPTIDGIPREHWECLAAKRIFFGHQSVGYNIVDGLRDVMEDCDYIRLDVVETSEIGEVEGPSFVHSKVGKNRDPLSKIEAFVDALDRSNEAQIDIAFMKFCYVDIVHDTDVNSLFEAYSRAMEQIRRKRPNLQLLHVTVPLRSVYLGPKWRAKQCVKRLIGSPTVLEDNLARDRFNQLLREAYPEDGAVFDLALAESTTEQGHSCYAMKSKARVPFLWTGYSADGGHLNTLGKRKAAEQLLIALAKAANK